MQDVAAPVIELHLMFVHVWVQIFESMHGSLHYYFLVIKFFKIFFCYYFGLVKCITLFFATASHNDLSFSQ